MRHPLKKYTHVSMHHIDGMINITSSFAYYFLIIVNNNGGGALCDLQ